jgi:hypothetical protein
VPQSKQTIISGKTHTTSLSTFFSLEKWMPISPVNLLWLTDAHDLQGVLLQLDRIGTKNPAATYSVWKWVQSLKTKLFY